MDLERKASTGSGITVHREIFVHTDEVLHDGMRSKSVTSICTTLQSQSAMRSGTPDHQSQTSSPPAPTGRNTWHGDTKPEKPRPPALKNDEELRRNDESLQYLADFLMKTPPPTNNRMSIPDNFSSTSPSNNANWLKTFGTIRGKRQKGSSRHQRHHHQRPPLIRLPDSAVAATTTGGFRHIAISIPIEHSYLGSRSRASPRIASIGMASKGPDFAQDIESRLDVIESRLASVRVGSPDKGSGSALKPVAESRESISSELSSKSTGISPRTRPAEPRPASPRTSQRGRDSVHSPTPDGMSPSSAKFRVKPPAADQRLLAEDGARNRSHPVVVVPKMTPGLTRHSSRTAALNGPHGGGATSNTASHAGLVRTASSKATNTANDLPFVLPERRASKQASTSKTIPQSIFANMLSPSTPQKSSQGTHNSNGSTNGNQQIRTRQRGSGTESVLTIESEPLVFDAQTAKAYHKTPIVVRPTSQYSLRSALALGGSQQQQQNSSPLPAVAGVASRSVQTDSSMFTPLQRVLSRKEKVRERKHKDVESMKSGRSEKPSSSTAQGHDTNVATTTPESPVIYPSTGLVDPSAIRTLPSHVSGGHATAHNKRHHEATSALNVSLPKEPIRATKRMLSSSTGSSRTTSSSTSPYDHIAYHLRQKQTTEQAGTSHATRRARRHAEEATLLATEQEIVEGLSRLELLRQYGKVKESRLRDLERRLRRLERNGDMCLMSMVPLMESVNQALDEQRRHDTRLSRSPFTAQAGQPDSPGSMFDVPRQMRATTRGCRYEHPLVEQLEENACPASQSILPQTINSAPVPVSGPIPPAKQEWSSQEQGRPAHMKKVIRETTRHDRKRDVDRETGLEKLEPLMRELQEAARLIFGDQAEGSTGHQIAESPNAEGPQQTQEAVPEKVSHRAGNIEQGSQLANRRDEVSPIPFGEGFRERATQTD